MQQASEVVRETVATAEAPAAIGPYSQGVVVAGGRTLYTSGQIALDPKTGAIVGEGDVRVQTERVLDNLAAVLAAAGMDFARVVRAGIFLADLGDFAVVNELYARRFHSAPPARSTVQVAGLPKGVLVEIDLIAVGP
ncbi:MAG: RidA family protein [Myxococcales bacterium]|nr:RidA family protein [Myxococcales bacterium]